MTILFTANRRADMKANTAIISTNTSHFDNLYAKEGWGWDLWYDQANQKSIFTPDPGGDYWLHFTVYLPSGTTSTDADGYWFSFRDANGAELAQLDFLDGTIAAKAMGDTNVVGSYVSVTTNALSQMDIRVSVGANIVVEWYVNGLLQSSATAANTGAKGACREVQFVHNDMTASIVKIYYSEIIIAGNESTVGYRLAELAPSAQGALNEWEGGFTEVADSNNNTFAASGTAGQRETWTLSAYGGSTGLSLHAISLSALAQKGQTGPQNLKQTLRIGTTNYDGANLPLPAYGLEQFETIWATNPATGAAWSLSDLTGLEAGLVSVT